MTSAGESKLLSEKAYDLLKADIIHCKLAPGSEWTEQQLRERYDISVASSRAALVKLVQEQLLISVPRRGYEVPGITLRDVREIFDLRMIIEPGVASLATTRATQTDLNALAELIRQARTQKRFHQEDYIEINRKWHISIAELSGNARAVRMVKQVIEASERILYMGITTIEQNRLFLDSHQEILDLMIAGNDSAVAEALSQHIAAAKEHVIESIYRSQKVMDLNLA